MGQVSHFKEEKYGDSSYTLEGKCIGLKDGLGCGVLRETKQ